MFRYRNNEKGKYLLTVLSLKGNFFDKRNTFYLGLLVCVTVGYMLLFTFPKVQSEVGLATSKARSVACKFLFVAALSRKQSFIGWNPELHKPTGIKPCSIFRFQL
jgi:hypothetical protein